MTLEIYKLTMFIICVSIGIQFAEASGIVPGVSTGYSDEYSNKGIRDTLVGMSQFMFGNAVPEDLTYQVLTLAIFGLLVFTLPFMLALFWFGYIIGVDFIIKLPINSAGLEVGLILLLAIIYMIGYKQYQANVSLKAF